MTSGEEYNYETPYYERSKDNRYNPHPGQTARQEPGKLEVAETEFLRRADLNNLNTRRDSTQKRSTKKEETFLRLCHVSSRHETGRKTDNKDEKDTEMAIARSNQGRLSGGNKWIGKQREAKERKTERENERNRE